MNLAGIVVGKSVQNLLSAVKILGLVGIFLAAVLCSSRGSLESTGTWGGSSLGLALVFVLYAYGGWNDAAFVAAEVRGQQRKLPLALFLGIGLITVIYLLVIMAYLAGPGVRRCTEIRDAGRRRDADGGGRWGTVHHQRTRDDLRAWEPSTA